MRLFRREPRREVNVDPVQLAALHFLLRFGPCAVDSVYEEVRNARPVERDVFTAAMADLAAQDVVDYRFQPEDGKTLLALTPLGHRLKHRLPQTSTARIAFYV